MLDELFKNLSRENLQNKFLQVHSENFDTTENLKFNEKVNDLAEFIHAIFVVKTIEASALNGLSSCEFETITLDELQNLLERGLDVQLDKTSWIVSWHATNN